MTTANPDLSQAVLALYRKVTGDEAATLSQAFTAEDCLRAIEVAFDGKQDAMDQALSVQQTEARIIRRLMEKLLEGEITEERAGIIRTGLEKAREQCNRILEEMPLKLGPLGEEEEEGDASAQLIDVIISAVADPSLYDEFQGERNLSEWQQDAVLAALDETGFDLVHDYDEFTDADLESLKAELNIANAMIEKLYQRVYDKLG